MKQSSKRVNPIDREQIEKVIAELEQISGNAFFMMDDADRSEHGKGVCAGRRTVAEYAINRLREVLINEDRNTHSADGHGTDDRRDGKADQVETVRSE